MGNRLSKIYTRTGDAGTTGLGDGTRVDKDNPRIEAIGCVDELNSAIGLLLAETLPGTIHAALLEIQHDLFDLGGELCIPGHAMINTEAVTRLEVTLDELNAELPALTEFILPGGSRGAACAHLARGICRRTERRVFTLSRTTVVNPPALAYLNRLADLLFVIARVLARAQGGEVLWNRQRGNV